MNTRTLINFAVITLCLSNAAIAEDTSNQAPTTVTKAQPALITLPTEQILAELKQDLSKSIETQVSATLSSLADTLKNIL